MMKVLNELSFKILNEDGIARFSLIPKDAGIKKVLFFNPFCDACQKRLEELTGQDFYAVDVNETPLLATHFNISYVPVEIEF